MTKRYFAFAIAVLHCIFAPTLYADSFADRQIAQMIDDRPSMRDIISPDHPIYRFAASKFASGGLSGRRVHWDRTEPTYGAENECQLLCVVRVASGDNYTGRDKWAMLIFELFNLSHADEVGKLRWQVVRGEIGKDQFVNDALRLEIDAMRKTQLFLREHSIPNVDPKVDDFYFRFLTTPSLFADYINFLDVNKTRLDYDPRVYNAKLYDSLRRYAASSQNDG